MDFSRYVPGPPYTFLQKNPQKKTIFFYSRSSIVFLSKSNQKQAWHWSSGYLAWPQSCLFGFLKTYCLLPFALLFYAFMFSRCTNLFSTNALRSWLFSINWVVRSNRLEPLDTATYHELVGSVCAGRVGYLDTGDGLRSWAYTVAPCFLALFCRIISSPMPDGVVLVGRSSSNALFW